MNLVTCAGSFLLGGVSAIMLMGLLLLFIENPLKKSEEYRLKKITLALLPLTETKNAEEMPRSKVGATLRALKSLSVKDRISLSQNAVTGRWGKVYTPVSEPLQ
jgi:hypothetical protein